jgi:magnesium chelatase family protein
MNLFYHRLFVTFFFFFQSLSTILPIFDTKRVDMLINIHAARCIGIDAVPVTVEIDVTAGIGIHLVGLADAAVKESLLRTITALQSMGFRIPGKKIVINLAPADMHKKGSGYDVPIALGIIASSGQMDLPLLSDFMIMGELSLDGGIRKVPGSLPIVELAARLGLKGCVLPVDSAMEAIEYGGVEVYAVGDLRDVLRILAGEEPCDDLKVTARKTEYMQRGQEGFIEASKMSAHMDFSEIIGQEGAKRGVEIACAGGHNVIMIGSPGSGKSSLAKAMAGILPPMTLEESVQTSKIYSVAGKGNPLGGLMRTRPFRSPHYSASVAALLGGGSDTILPGEISLAHNGILMIDEFCEAPKKILEVLRAPMEDRKVIISRLKSKVEFPADFMLVAAANPCPCGFYGEGDRCTCSPSRRIAYLSRLSGPIIDRIDIQIWMHPIESRKLVERPSAEPSAVVAQRVLKARDIQRRRFAEEGIFCNAAMNNRMIEKYCPLDDGCKILLERLIDRMGLSARACTRIIKLARTIADLAGVPDILPEHISEAAGYRFLDRQSIL